jgi:hypothetical protein
MIHRQEEQKAIEGMDFWRDLSRGWRNRKSLTLTEHVLIEIHNDILEERKEMLTRDERGMTTGGNVQRYSPSRKGLKTTIPDQETRNRRKAK